MKEKCKRYRDSAKMSVFSHIGSSVLAVIVSGIVSTLINYYYQVTAFEKNVNIFSGDFEVYKITLAVLLLSGIANLPLSFCASRFYLVISRKSMFEKASAKELFAPFANPLFLLKGAVLLFFTSILTVLGAFVLVFPIYFMYCMAVFVMCDNPDISPLKALTLSRRMMKGNKWLAFRTTLPVLALQIVCALFLNSIFFFSFFITALVEAVFFVTLASIYNDIKNQ